VFGWSCAGAATIVRQDALTLELRPRVCTLSPNDEQCSTVVNARWHSPRNESLCLVIVGRPDVKRCWENYSKGLYTVELAFSEDLIVELRDPQLQNVLVTQAVKVIREALQLRRKRRQPWNIF
jgi:hypothetical protein